MDTSRFSINVVKAPNQILRAATKPVKKITPRHLALIKEMIKLAKSFTDPEGVGLAANQIGLGERFFVAKIGDFFQAFFNPKILSKGKKTKVFFEGCLSIPNYYGETVRPTSITVSYQNIKGEKVTKKLAGTPAWIFQHEVDHLNGGLFMDKVLEQKGRVFKVTGKDKAGEDVFEEVKLS